MKPMEKKKNEYMAECEKFHIRMQREMILKRLKEEGYRITKQRNAVIRIILEQECASCKEIFYQSAKINKKIGAATIYRTINILEEIGAIDRKNLYRISDWTEDGMVTVILEDGEKIEFTTEEWRGVLQKGLQSCGYKGKAQVNSVVKGGTYGA